MAVLNGWINGLVESKEVLGFLQQLNEDNGIVSNKVFMNGEVGYQFYINHNHSGFSFDFFFEKLKAIVAIENKEMHGIIYFYDDEDPDYFDTWQVWTIRKRTIEKNLDNYLSPYSEKVAVYEDEC